MGFLITQINDTLRKLDKLMEIADTRRTILKTLSVGDLVYEEGTYGDMFEQVIMSIDLDDLEIEVFEASINLRKRVESFYIFDHNNDKFTLIQ